jgi:hypothetical protein
MGRHIVQQRDRGYARARCRNVRTTDGRGGQTDRLGTIADEPTHTNILSGNVLTVSAPSPAIDDVRWVGQSSSVGCYRLPAGREPRARGTLGQAQASFVTSSPGGHPPRSTAAAITEFECVRRPLCALHKPPVFEPNNLLRTRRPIQPGG